MTQPFDIDDDVPEERRRKTDAWHVGKEIPLAVLVVLIFQTVGVVWSISQMAAKLDYAVSTLQTFQSERYTREDARHDRELWMAKFETMTQKDIDHDRRLTSLESGIDSYSYRRGKP